jgi:hypothetical protein
MSQHQVTNRLSSRSLALGMLASASFLALLGGSVAHAETVQATKAKSPARSCQTAFQSAQDKEKAGKLVEASQLFASCSDEVCGTSIWHECVTRNTHLRASLPSIIPLAVDQGGAPRADVEVTMDGHVITSQLTGRAIPVDPGPHEFSFSTGSGVFASAKITVVEGERNRPLSVSCPAPANTRLSATAQK